MWANSLAEQPQNILYVSHRKCSQARLHFTSPRFCAGLEVIPCPIFKLSFKAAQKKLNYFAAASGPQLFALCCTNSRSGRVLRLESPFRLLVHSVADPWFKARPYIKYIELQGFSIWLNKPSQICRSRTLRNFLVRRSFSWDTGLTNSAQPPPLPLHDIAAQIT